MGTIFLIRVLTKRTSKHRNLLTPDDDITGDYLYKPTSLALSEKPYNALGTPAQRWIAQLF